MTARQRRSSDGLRFAGWALTAAWVGATALLAWAPQWLIAALGGQGGSYWMRAAFGPFGLRCLAGLSGGVLLLSLLGAWMYYLRGGGRRRAAEVVGAAGGTAIIEFCMLFPIALLLFLVVVQIALMYNANFYVNYAAFCAARSARVWAEYGSTSDEQYTLIPGPHTQERAEKAAAWACVGISGWKPVRASGRPEAQLAVWQAFLDPRQPRWLNERLMRQFTYAREHTRVTILTEPRPDQAGWESFYNDREPIYARVAHDFHLRVPYAQRFLGDPHGSGSFRYVVLNATSATVNEAQAELLGGAVP